MQDVIDRIEDYQDAVIAHEQARALVEQFNRDNDQRIQQLDDQIKVIQRSADIQIAEVQEELDAIVAEEKRLLDNYHAAFQELGEATSAYKTEIHNIGARVAANVQRFPGDPAKWKAERGTPEG